jgi:hypothetical protein
MHSRQLHPARCSVAPVLIRASKMIALRPRTSPTSSPPVTTPPLRRFQRSPRMASPATRRGTPRPACATDIGRDEAERKPRRLSAT